MRRVVHLAISLVGVLTLTAALTAQSTIRYIYDELGRLVGVIDGSGDAAVYHYDAVGNLLSITRSTSTQVTVIDFSPDSGPIGQTVTIYGTGFSATAASNSVSFNGTSASIASATTTSLTVTVPSGATSGTIAVTSPNGSDTSDTSFTVTASATPSITSFSPTSGVAGTSITITGANFETSAAANNQTRYNSTFTIPTASTSTTVTAPVPSSTGSGKVRIKTPAGIAVSADDLIIPPQPHVVADVATADRLSFASPATATISPANKIGLRLFDGSPGQRVSVLGTNGLSGQVLGCDVLVNIWNPFATATAPGTCMEGSGFIDATTLTAAGTYTVLIDPVNAATGSVTLTLYDVPADYSASITPGGSSVTATMSTPGQNGVLTFTGTANQRISLRGTNGISGQVGLTCDVTATIVKPNGVALASPTCMEGSGYLDVTTLPASGQYRIIIDPASAATGSLTLTLYDVPADSSGSITAGGSSVTVTLSTPGRNGTLTFSGTSGQKISLRGTNGMSGQIGLGGCDVNVTVLKPDTTALAPATCMEGSGFLDATALPSTGTYTILIDPASYAVGSLTLQLYDVTDYSGTITAGGSSVTVSLPTPGQNGTLTFSGTSDQRISLRGTNGMSGQIGLGGCDVNVTVLKPDATELSPATCMESSGFLDAQILPSTGTYTILVDPTAYAVGSLTLELYDVPADTAGSVSIGGSAVSVSLGTPGQNGTLTFSGTANQQITVHMTSNAYGQVTVKLLKPDGSQLTSSTSASASFNLATQTLPTTGTYTIVVDPVNANTGSINVSVSTP